ncbi:hypothetical protein Z950_1104 [Sulfitobacter mediterraneus KCTC 32188]|nr:hypothetical protein Z950_1104 [Sulfitobacter mediterraneus KCTC 32188]
MTEERDKPGFRRSRTNGRFRQIAYEAKKTSWEALLYYRHIANANYFFAVTKSAFEPT